MGSYWIRVQSGDILNYSKLEAKLVEELLAEFPTRRMRTAALRALTLPKEFFSNLRARRSRLKMEHLFCVLDFIGYRPHAWIFNALAEVTDPEVDLHQKPWPPRMEGLSDSHPLHESTSRALDYIDSGVHDLMNLEDLKGFNLLMVMRSWVTENPALVESKFDVAQRFVHPRLLPRFHSTLGSALRRLTKYDEAWLAFDWAERLASMAADRHCKADNWQRTAHLYNDLGEPSKSVELATKSVAGFTLLSDHFGIGRASIALGLSLVASNEYREAIFAFRKALDLLPKSEIQGHAAAMQNISRAYVEIKDWENAVDSARRLERYLADAKPPFGRSKLSPLVELHCADFQGWMLLLTEDHASAANAFERAYSGYISGGFFYEAAMVSLPLCRALVASHRIDAAENLALGTRTLLDHLEGNSAPRKAINLLVSTVLTGRKLNLAEMERHQEALLRARARGAMTLPLPSAL